jgi:hypothetical protein
MRKRASLIATIVALTFALIMPASIASATGSRVFVDFVPLSGANEVGGGDPDGRGFAVIVIVPQKDLVCWFNTWRGLDSGVFGHIHNAPAGVNGPVVVPFQQPAGVESPRHGCIVDADADLIVANPSAYYVNLHTPNEFPGGAIRGQLD